MNAFAFFVETAEEVELPSLLEKVGTLILSKRWHTL